MEEGDVDDQEGRGLLVFSRCRGCGGRSSRRRSIPLKGVLGKASSTTTSATISWKIKCKVLGGWVHHDRRGLLSAANEGFRLSVIEVNLWNAWRVVDG
jgi:hypothetical protein